MKFLVEELSKIFVSDDLNHLEVIFLLTNAFEVTLT